MLVALAFIAMPGVALAAPTAVRVTLPWEAKDIAGGSATLTCDMVDAGCAILDTKSKTIRVNASGLSSGKSVFFFTGSKLKQAAGAICRIHSAGVNGDARSLTSKPLPGMQMQCAISNQGQPGAQASSGMSVYVPQKPLATTNGLNFQDGSSALSPAIAGTGSAGVVVGGTMPGGAGAAGVSDALPAVGGIDGNRGRLKREIRAGVSDQKRAVITLDSTVGTLMFYGRKQAKGSEKINHDSNRGELIFHGRAIVPMKQNRVESGKEVHLPELGFEGVGSANAKVVHLPELGFEGVGSANAKVVHLPELGFEGVGSTNGKVVHLPELGFEGVGSANGKVVHLPELGFEGVGSANGKVVHLPELGFEGVGKKKIELTAVTLIFHGRKQAKGSEKINPNSNRGELIFHGRAIAPMKQNRVASGKEIHITELGFEGVGSANGKVVHLPELGFEGIGNKTITPAVADESIIFYGRKK